MTNIVTNQRSCFAYGPMGLETLLSRQTQVSYGGGGVGGRGGGLSIFVGMRTNFA
jgi:hypothetical protein